MISDKSAVKLHFTEYIEANKHRLVPPVCNMVVHHDGDIYIMIVGGPNTRKDYHMNRGEELFFQIKGSMCLKIMEKGVPKDIIIKEGEMFLLPAEIPHSPQRFEGTIGLVIEHRRQESDMDGLVYFVDDSNKEVLFQRFFHCTDLGRQLKPLIEEFLASKEYTTRKPVATSIQTDGAWEPDRVTTIAAPFNLKEMLVNKLSKGGPAFTIFDNKFMALVCNNETILPANFPIDKEVWVWVLPDSSPQYSVKLKNKFEEVIATACETVLLYHGISSMEVIGEGDAYITVLIVYIR
eukprot:Tbor_TRINITY_DN5222_c0_g7::TRINITY_DN5222_c0_g7_i2::g.16377::m.16377/K00452/HAAO; 3-hydroxyanthranilate 3,4-dioxygenase